MRKKARLKELKEKSMTKDEMEECIKLLIDKL